MRARRSVGVGLAAAVALAGCSTTDDAPTAAPVGTASSAAPVVVPPPRPGPDGRLAADQWPDPCTLLDRAGGSRVPGTLADGFALPNGLSCSWTGPRPVEVRLETVSTEVGTYWDGLIFRTARFQDVEGPWDEAVVELTAQRPTLLLCSGMTVVRLVGGTWEDDPTTGLLELGRSVDSALRRLTAGQPPPA